MILAFEAPSARPDETLLWAGAFAGATLLGALAVGLAPLAAYVWLIALFGMPHVIAEMRYCDERFSGRSSGAALAVILALLAGLALARAGGAYGVVDPMAAALAELGFGAALAVAAALFMRRRRLVGLLAAALIVFGALYYPFETFLVWAWLHNLTPLGFVAEATTGRRRVLALAALSVPFFVVPAFVAAGGLDWIVSGLGYDAASGPSALAAGRKPFAAFLPSGLSMERAIPLFQAAVLAQIMHYVAVIGLLPRLLADGAMRPGRLAPWPRWPVFYGLLAAAGLASAAFYAVDFAEARTAYALAAALHSWIELPIFLMALGGGFTLARVTAPPDRRSPPEPTPR